MSYHAGEYSLYYLFVDTETTGVPKRQYSDWSECRLIQIGMVVKDKNFVTVGEELFMIEYDGTNGTTFQAYNVHGISDKERTELGVPGKYACECFISIAKKCDIIVMHGAVFDLGVILRECMLNDVDFSCLIGKCLIDTKMSERYIGYHENLVTTVQRLNPDWKPDTMVLMNNYPHDALYDAHLCAELFKHSHSPYMIRPLEDTVGYLNSRGYTEGIDELSTLICNIRQMHETNHESIDINEEACDVPEMSFLSQQSEEIDPEMPCEEDAEACANEVTTNSTSEWDEYAEEESQDTYDSEWFAYEESTQASPNMHDNECDAHNEFMTTEDYISRHCSDVSSFDQYDEGELHSYHSYEDYA